MFGHNNITVDNLETSETEEGELITGEVTVEILSPEVIVNETDTEEDLVLAIAKMDGMNPASRSLGLMLLKKLRRRVSSKYRLILPGSTT